MPRMQYPSEYPASSRLNHCDCSSQYCARLAEYQKKIDNAVVLATCWFGTLEYSLRSNPNSLANDDND